MKKKDQRLFDLYEAFVLIVIRHTHELFGEDLELGSLAPLEQALERALRHTAEGPQIESWLLEQLGREVRHALRVPWGPGDVLSRETAWLRVVVNDLRPVVGGRRGLARQAGVMLAVLLGREDDAEALAASLR